MKDLLVTMYCTKPSGMFDDYLRQLAEAGIDTHVDRLQSFPNENSGGTMAYKIESFRRRALQFRDYGKIVYTCAWDVMFFGSKEDVLRKIPDEGVILGAERGCYPDRSIAERFKGDTPWRFVNGGPMAGTPESILKWLEAVENHPLYKPLEVDQFTLNLMRAEDSPLTPIDDRTELFYCMWGEHGELDFENGLPVNTLCGTHPQFIHFNGRHDPTDAMNRRARSLEGK